jgi:hypothetical protein
MGREEDGVVWLCHDNNSCNNTVQLWAKSIIPGLLHNNFFFR